MTVRGRLATLVVLGLIAVADGCDSDDASTASTTMRSQTGGSVVPEGMPSQTGPLPGAAARRSPTNRTSGSNEPADSLPAPTRETEVAEERPATGQPAESAANSAQQRRDTVAPPAVDSATAAEPPAARHTTPAKTVASPENSRPVECTFDNIKFPLEKGDPFDRHLLTQEIENLLGRRIRIRGFILPGFQQSGLTQFVLVRDNMECCFGPGAALYDCIVVEMVAGKTTEFSTRPVAVTGTFSINELIGPDGSHLAIYHLLGETVTQ